MLVLLVVRPVLLVSRPRLKQVQLLSSPPLRDLSTFRTTPLARTCAADAGITSPPWPPSSSHLIASCSRPAPPALFARARPSTRSYHLETDDEADIDIDSSSDHQSRHLELTASIRDTARRERACCDQAPRSRPHHRPSWLPGLQQLL